MFNMVGDEWTPAYWTVTCFATLSEDVHRCNIVHMPLHNVDWHLNSYFNVTDEEKVDKYFFFFLICSKEEGKMKSSAFHNLFWSEIPELLSHSG